MHLHDIHNLFEYNYWANHRILGVVETMQTDQILKDLGSSHGGIHGTLVHMMGAEEIWIRRWKGESPASFYTASEFPTFEAVANRWEMVEMEMMGFCHMLKIEEDLKQIISYKDLKGNPYSQPLWQLMQHLANHSTYHRGQIVTMMRQLGTKPVGTDLVSYFRLQKS